MRLAGSFGFMTVLTLLPDYIDAPGATDITIGVFIAALELARTVGTVLANATVGVFLFVEDDETSIEGVAFTDLAVNRRILTMATFRVQYAVAVTLVRKWIPIFIGVSAAKGGLAYGSGVVGTVLAAEKFTNMLGQPITGRLSDRIGRAPFVVGGSVYGGIAIVYPFISGAELLFSLSIPILGDIFAAIVIAVLLNGLLGIADAFREPASMALFADECKGQGIASSMGIRDLLWKPGSVLAPLLGGWLMGPPGSSGCCSSAALRRCRASARSSPCWPSSTAAPGYPSGESPRLSTDARTEPRPLKWCLPKALP